MKLKMRGSNENNNSERKDILIEDGKYEVEVLDVYVNKKKYINGMNFMIDENGNNITELNIGIRYMIREDVEQKYQRVSKFDNFNFDKKMLWKIEQYAYALNFDENSELDASLFVGKLLGSNFKVEIEKYIFNEKESNRVKKVYKSEAEKINDEVDYNVDEIFSEKEVVKDVIKEELENDSLIDNLLLD